MQPVPVNYLGVLLAAVASMVLGFVWYGPLLGKPWMKEMGMTDKDMKEAQKKMMGPMYLLSFVGSLVMAFVLAHSTVFAGSYMKVSGASAGLQAGFWSWLGFVAPVQMTDVLFGGKSWKLYQINTGYQLASLLLMGLVLGWMM
jgi:hypothetical protein